VGRLAPRLGVSYAEVLVAGKEPFIPSPKRYSTKFPRSAVLAAPVNIIRPSCLFRLFPLGGCAVFLSWHSLSLCFFFQFICLNDGQFSERKRYFCAFPCTARPSPFFPVVLPQYSLPSSFCHPGGAQSFQPPEDYTVFHLSAASVLPRDCAKVNFCTLLFPLTKMPEIPAFAAQF